MLSACGFVHRATHDGYGLSYDDLTALIAEVEARRAANEPFAPWVDEQRTLRRRCESWDGALGLLYARRSSAVARDQAYVSVAGTIIVTMWTSSKLSSSGAATNSVGGVLGATIGTLFGVCLVPIDVIVAPIWFVDGAIGHVRVGADDLVRAASDLQKARELGVTETQVEGTGYWGWPYPHHTHLDALGYDAEWLKHRESR